MSRKPFIKIWMQECWIGKRRLQNFFPRPVMPSYPLVNITTWWLAKIRQSQYTKIIKGELSEHVYNPKNLTIIELNNLTENSIGYIDNCRAIHRMSNESKKENCVSLHIYSPPNFVATLY